MYRSEYPRPEFKREEWLSLNGQWDFCFPGEEMRKIEVPFVFQSEMSGIHENRMCDSVTYKRSFCVPDKWKGKRIRIHFGAVDYACSVFINEKKVGSHQGGNTPFSFDITEELTWKKEEICVQVWDPCRDETIPRGKQFWKKDPDSIWYTRSTGIWQSVFIEPVSEVHFSYIRFTPDIDRGTVEVKFKAAGLKEKIGGCHAEFAIIFKEREVFRGGMELLEDYGRMEISLFDRHIFRTMNHDGGWCWSPESPNLFDVGAALVKEGETIDQVCTYFGMRKIEQKNGMVYLNNRPYYQKLILDQGYWPGSLMTAQDEQDFVKDIEMAKAMGFNGCRKHQKAEDPVFLYYADRIGFLVWSEISACASYSLEASQRTVTEWGEAIQRDYNHPCIVAWVVLNESWGVPNICFDKRQQAHSLALYYNAKSMDTTRLVISNDGWEITKTDICAIHNYTHGEQSEPVKQEIFRKTLSTKEDILKAQPAGRQIYADGFGHQGEPVLLTEFGGLAYAKDREKGWGYTTIENEEEFLEVYGRILKDIADSEILFGFCYTQLCDVEQEVNGLLTYDRKYKVAPEKIKAINDSVRKDYL